MNPFILTAYLFRRASSKWYWIKLTNTIFTKIKTYNKQQKYGRKSNSLAHKHQTKYLSCTGFQMRILTSVSRYLAGRSVCSPPLQLIYTESMNTDQTAWGCPNSSWCGVFAVLCCSFLWGLALSCVTLFITSVITPSQIFIVHPSQNQSFMWYSSCFSVMIRCRVPRPIPRPERTKGGSQDCTVK